MTDRRFGRFRLEGELGRGGMAVVHRAVDDATGEVVALKTVASPSPEVVASIRREVAALARLRHPGVVRIVEHGVAEGMPWYAMELLEGESLRARASTLLAETPTSPFAPGAASPAEPASPALADAADAPPLCSTEGALELVRRLCEPLAYLHGEGVVHRDLKPENVLVRTDGSVVIVDFGLATTFAASLLREDLVERDGVAGTLWYMAPEQIRGDLVDARADLYALGCILHELLTGRPPFVDSSPGNLLAMHLEKAPEPPSRLRAGLPAELDALVLGLLEKDPSRRVGYADVVASALARLDLRAGLAPAPSSACTGVARVAARPYLYRPRVAGRDAPLARLRQLVSGLAARRGGLVLVSGESGGGKTRLVQEALSAAAERGFPSFVGECADATRGRERPPLGGLRRALQAIADSCSESGRGFTRRVVGPWGKVLAPYEPRLGSLAGLDEEPDPPALPPEMARSRVFEALASVFEALAARKPVVTVLDDLHWADDLLLSFLLYLLDRGRLGKVGWLVIGTYRGEEREGTLLELERKAGVELLRLERLDEAAVSSMVASMLASAAPDDSFGALAAATEGNPFFVGEYLRAALEEGRIERDDAGRWRVAEATARPGASPLPSTVRELVGRRLARLGPVARRIAEAAAVLGGGLVEERLARVSGVARDAVVDAIPELLSHPVLEEEADGTLRFAHARIREVLSEALPAERRLDLHRMAAEAVEAEGDPAQAAALARHWELGGDPARAAPLYARAAQRALARHALDEAERLCRAHVRLAATDAEVVKSRLALAEGILPRRGAMRAALEEAETALAGAQALGRRELVGRSQREIGKLRLALGDLDGARARLEESRSTMAEMGDAGGEAKSLLVLGDLEDRVGAKQRAGELYDEALRILERAGETEVLGQCLSRIADVRFETGEDLGKAAETYRLAIAAHRTRGDVANEWVSLGNLAILTSQGGDLSGGRALYEEALRMSATVIDRPNEAIYRLNLAGLSQQEGRFPEARLLVERALELVREAGNRRMEAIILSCRAALHDRMGLAEGEPLEEARRAREMARESGDTWSEAGCLENLAFLARQTPAEAVGLVDEAIAIGRASGNRMGEAALLLQRAELAIQLGRAAAAAGDLEQALELCRSFAAPLIEARVLLGLARLRRVTRQGDAAEPLARAESVFSAAGARVDLAECAIERALVERAAGRDRAEPLARARRLVAELGLDPRSEIERQVARLELPVLDDEELQACGIGMRRDEVVLREHDPRWSACAAAESAGLRAALPGLELELAHVGSTAVPGLLAKPILDLLGTCADVAALDERAAALTAIGYESKGEYGIPGRRYAVRYGAARTISLVHLHVYPRGHPEIARHLRFRDALGADAELAGRYGDLKRALGDAHPRDREGYLAGKACFISDVLGA